MERIRTQRHSAHSWLGDFVAFVWFEGVLTCKDFGECGQSMSLQGSCEAAGRWAPCQIQPLSDTFHRSSLFFSLASPGRPGEGGMGRESISQIGRVRYKEIFYSIRTIHGGAWLSKLGPWFSASFLARKPVILPAVPSFTLGTN